MVEMRDYNEDEVIIICNHVFNKDRRVNLVIHHNDGMWQMTCGEFDHEQMESELKTVHAHHLIDRQPDLRPLLNLEIGYMAEYSNSEWEILSHDE